MSSDDDETVERMVEYVGGKVVIPDEFADESRLTVRTPWYTVVHTSNTYTFYGSKNEHLNRGEVSFKRDGEEAVVYRIKGAGWDDDQLTLTEASKSGGDE